MAVPKEKGIQEGIMATGAWAAPPAIMRAAVLMQDGQPPYLSGT
jgi:hypothetical protein